MSQAVAFVNDPEFLRSAFDFGLTVMTGFANSLTTLWTPGPPRSSSSSKPPKTPFTSSWRTTVWAFPTPSRKRARPTRAFPT